MNSSTKSCTDETMKDKSDAYRFLFENACFSRSKTFSYTSSKEFNEFQEINIDEKDKKNDCSSTESKTHSKFCRKSSYDYIFCSISEQSCKMMNSNPKSECTQEHEIERCCIKNSILKPISDVNHTNQIRMISDFNYGLINSIDYHIYDKPCIILDNDDIDGLLIPNVEAVAFSESYEDDFLPNNIIVVTDSKQSKGKEFASDELIKINNDKTKSKWSGRTDENRKEKSKYNSFSLGRTCFRTMSNYFKSLFEPILKEWEKDETTDSKVSMDELVKTFILKEFNFSKNFTEMSNFNSFIDCMITILHSHNHRKSDDYIKRCDFKKIRNLLYCYSAHARNLFISNKNYALIFNNFYMKAGAETIKCRIKDKPQEFINELLRELDDIQSEALKTISEN